MSDTRQSISAGMLTAASRDPEKIAHLIEQTAKEVFGDNKLGHLLTSNPWKEVARTIKQTFADLGQKLGYQVATSGFPGRFDPSWVYDLLTSH
jgi:hypothetical protein